MQNYVHYLYFYEHRVLLPKCLITPSSRRGTKLKFPFAFICYTPAQCINAEPLPVPTAGKQEQEGGMLAPHVAGEAFTSPPTI